VSTDLGRVVAVARKEFREYRRNRFIVGTMLALPVVFLVLPVAAIFRLTASTPHSAIDKQVGSTLLTTFIIPVVVPAAIAAYSVVGERDQGTLEPLLTTPVRRQELLLGKALGAIIPSVLMGYLFFAVLAVAVRIGATQHVVDLVWQPSEFLAQALFSPLLAGWSIWVGIGISARSTDVRVAQQLSTLASLPALGVTALFTFQVLSPSVTLAVVLALALAVVDVAAWWAVSATFDRERLITGRSATPVQRP
jgi:ABC-type Na+ efflux pump permease subunit